LINSGEHSGKQGKHNEIDGDDREPIAPNKFTGAVEKRIGASRDGQSDLMAAQIFGKLLDRFVTPFRFVSESLENNVV